MDMQYLLKIRRLGCYKNLDSACKHDRRLQWLEITGLAGKMFVWLAIISEVSDILFDCTSAACSLAACNFRWGGFGKSEGNLIRSYFCPLWDHLMSGRLINIQNRFFFAIHQMWVHLTTWVLWLRSLSMNIRCNSGLRVKVNPCQEVVRI